MNECRQVLTFQFDAIEHSARVCRRRSIQSAVVVDDEHIDALAQLHLVGLPAFVLDGVRDAAGVEPAFLAGLRLAGRRLAGHDFDRLREVQVAVGPFPDVADAFLAGARRGQAHWPCAAARDGHEGVDALADIYLLAVDACLQPDAALRRAADAVAVHGQAEVEHARTVTDGDALRRIDRDRGLFGDDLAVLDDDLHGTARRLRQGGCRRCEAEGRHQ